MNRLVKMGLISTIVIDSFLVKVERTVDDNSIMKFSPRKDMCKQERMRRNGLKNSICPYEMASEIQSNSF